MRSRTTRRSRPSAAPAKSRLDRAHVRRRTSPSLDGARGRSCARLVARALRGAASARRARAARSRSRSASTTGRRSRARARSRRRRNDAALVTDDRARAAARLRAAAAGAAARRAPRGVRGRRAATPAARRPRAGAASSRCRSSAGAQYSAEASLRRDSRASGCSTPSSSSTPTTARAQVVAAVAVVAAAIAAISASSAALGARRRRARRTRRASVRVVGLEPDAGGEAVGGERAGDVGRAARAPRRARRASCSRRASGDARRRRGRARARARGAATPRRRPATSASASEGSSPSRKRSTCGRRLRADELGDDLAVLERLDGRDALDPEGRGDARVGVGVELGERRPCPRARRRPARAPGVSWRHGPHHSAQKSTTTGSSCERSMTSRSKVASVASKITTDEDRLRAMTELRASTRDGVTLAGEEAGEGTPGRAAARPDRDAPLRRDGLAARSSARGHRVSPTTRAATAQSAPAPTRTPTATTTLAARPAARCSTTAGSSARCWPAPRWARTRCCAFALDAPRARRRRSWSITPAFDPERRRRDAARRAGTRSRDGPARGRRRGLRRGLRRRREVPEQWRETVDTRPAPAAGRPRAPRRGRRRAAGGAALAPVRVAGTSSRALDVPDGRRRQPRRGRPRAPATRSASATRRRSPARGCVTEEPGSSPLAWQGGQLSRVIAELAAQAGMSGARRCTPSLRTVTGVRTSSMPAEDFDSLPPDLPVPVDDGAADHLPGLRLPRSRCGDHGRRGRPRGGRAAAGTLVLYVYSAHRHARASLRPTAGTRSRARAAARRRAARSATTMRELRALGAGVLGPERAAGRGAGGVRRARAAAVRAAVRPGAGAGGGAAPADVRGRRHAALQAHHAVAEGGAIAKAFYPVFPPDRNAADVLAWLRERR